MRPLFVYPVEVEASLSLSLFLLLFFSSLSMLMALKTISALLQRQHDASVYIHPALQFYIHNSVKVFVPGQIFASPFI